MVENLSLAKGGVICELGRHEAFVEGRGVVCLPPGRTEPRGSRCCTTTPRRRRSRRLESTREAHAERLLHEASEGTSDAQRRGCWSSRPSCKRRSVIAHSTS